VRNARIFTADDAQPFAEAMAIRGGALVFVGGDAEAASFVGGATNVVDLGGAVVLPGLHDVHQHTLEAQLGVIDCLLDPEVTDPELYVPEVAACATSSGTGWILGHGHRIETLLSASRAPRLILDAAISDRPVAIMEETSHSTWVNTRALELLGVDRTTVDPQGGVIDRDPDGSANGLLIDAAGELPWEQALRASDELRRLNHDALLEGLALNAENGITSAVDARAYWQRGYLDAYRAARDEGALTTRMVLSLWASPLADDDAQIEALRGMFADDGGRLRVTQVKIYSDGLLQNTTAALLEPYLTTERLAGPSGLNYFPAGRLNRYVSELGAAGFDAHIHAIGDRAVREALDAIAGAMSDPSAQPHLHRLTHVELLAPSDLERFNALGAGADMQLGEHSHRDVAARDLAPWIGAARARERSFSLRDLWDTNAVVALSSDYDVGEISPFAGMQRALELGEQSLPDVAAAVHAYTTNGALIMGSEETTGALRASMAADFVVLDRDLFEIPVAQISQTRVQWTVVGGEEVYRAPGFTP